MDKKNLLAMSSIVPVGKKLGEENKKKIERKLRELFLPNIIEIGLPARDMDEQNSTLANDIVNMANQIKSVCTEFDIHIKDLKSQLDRTATSEDQIVHSINVLECLTHSKIEAGKQCIVYEEENTRQMLIVQVFEKHELVKIHKNALNIRTSFAGVLARELLMDTQGKSKLDKKVDLSSEVELIPLDRISLID